MALNLTETIDQHCIDAHPSGAHFPTIKLRFSPSMTILIYFIYLLPFCFGVFGNISVCLIFFQQKKLRSITNTFLMNLCLNDLIVLCVSIPMTLSSALLEHWIFGEFFCKFLNFTPTLTALVSTFTVATIAVERWFFIVNKRKFDRRCTLLTLILLWIVSILIALPEFLSRYLQEFAPPLSFPPATNDSSTDPQLPMPETLPDACYVKKIYFCVFNPGLNTRIFSYIVITVQYLVPFLFVSISCYSISRFLKNRMKQMRAYQIYRPKSKDSSFKRHFSNKDKIGQNSRDEAVEPELTSYDDVPSTIIKNETSTKSSANSSTTACNDRRHYQNSVVIDQQNYRSSSVVGTILLPSEKRQSHSKRRFHRSRKLLICVAALFTISWLPLTVVQIYLEHNEEITQNEPNFVYAFLLIPCYLISSLSAWMNPVIYNYINRSFRREFYALYPCCCRLSSGSSSVDTSRTEMATIVGHRSIKRDLNSTVSPSNFHLSTSTQTFGTRFVSFSDRDTNDKPSLVLVNQQKVDV